ncbi:deleted in malignant brain tumors 1 protein-like [Pomacea canaliculata]|uniref:deleted in malignant brain tumors 1 protein-like n=1 Tax=Pomacea canaliculata TaxID=400727 RepID=UPI000D737830|nr:deleted in malignant brain tumors 1 protein-like [Pomacea canaliculata]XP_025102869.1 deleted in malignant brain tumors 1 protein-like [Pomacea canaliculata]
MLYVVGTYVLSVLLFARTAGQLTARLVNGTNYAGRLEILYNGTWSTVCDDFFENIDAQVACRMLGFYSPGAVAVSSNMYGAGQGSILLDDVNCLGTETSLEQCSHPGYYRHNCAHQEDIGVICNIPGQLTARLVNGTQWAGRLEILYNGTWSTVCDDDFGKEEAKVACRMMGFSRAEVLQVGSVVYGPGQGTILLDDVICQGTETSLDQCSHLPFYQHNCQHVEDIGVICSNQSSQLRLAGTSQTSLLMGRPEIFFREWTMLCLITNETAKVICRTLGFPSTNAVVVASSFGPLQGRFLSDRVACVGNETSLFSCISSVTSYLDSCTIQRGVICSDSIQTLYIVAGANSSITSYPFMEGTKCESKM